MSAYKLQKDVTTIVPAVTYEKEMIRMVVKPQDTIQIETEMTPHGSVRIIVNDPSRPVVITEDVFNAVFREKA